MAHAAQPKIACAPGSGAATAIQAALQNESVVILDVENGEEVMEESPKLLDFFG